MGDQFRYIGKDVIRRDAVDIVTGRAKYVNDLKFPDLLIAHQ